MSAHIDTIKLGSLIVCGLLPYHTTLAKMAVRYVSCACIAWAVNPGVAAHDPRCSSLAICQDGSPFSASRLEVNAAFATTVENKRAFTAFDSQRCHHVCQMAKLHCVPLIEVGRKSEVVIGGTSDETFDVHVKGPYGRKL